MLIPAGESRTRPGLCRHVKWQQVSCQMARLIQINRLGADVGIPGRLALPDWPWPKSQRQFWQSVKLRSKRSSQESARWETRRGCADYSSALSARSRRYKERSLMPRTLASAARLPLCAWSCATSASRSTSRKERRGGESPGPSPRILDCAEGTCAFDRAVAGVSMASDPRANST